MNTQKTYTLLSNRFSLIRNSMYSRIGINIILSIVFTSIILALYLFFISFNDIKDYEKELITGQIKHTLSLTESKRLTSNYAFITKSIKHIPLVESVILFNKSCEVIGKIPLNANNPSICSEEVNSDSWVHYKINDSFSDLYLVAVYFKSSAFGKARQNIAMIALIVITFCDLMFSSIPECFKIYVA